MMARTLKPSGYAILTTNNLAALHYRLELLLGKQPRCLHPSKLSHNPLGLEPPFSGHKSVFTYGHLTEVLEWHGFQIEASGTHTVYPLPVALSNVITKIFPQIGTYSYFKLRRRY